MRRLALLVIVSLIAMTGGVSAYGGPGSLTYDETLNTIRVVFKSQSPVLTGGWAKFDTTAHVPIDADTVGQPLIIEVRMIAAPADVVLGSCSYVPQWADVGTTKTITCPLAAAIPVTGTGVVDLYPYVIRNAMPGLPLVHDGRALALLVPAIDDDVFEQNDTLPTARDLGDLINLGAEWQVLQTNLASRDNDYFTFRVPTDPGVTEISIEFWNDIADLDLFVYSSNGQFLAASGGYTGREAVRIVPAPGATYAIYVRNYALSPALYDLKVTHSPPDTVTITSGPGGSPNPVTTGGTVDLSVAAADSLGDPLSYFWQSSCPVGLGSHGTFSPSPYFPQARWIAPANSSGTTQACTITVTIFDPYGNQAQGSYVQQVYPVDTVTITTPPSGTPNPVASSGPVSVTVGASDTFGHPLTYLWTGSCPTLAHGGSFSGSGATRAWQAPPNRTGAPQVCTIGVTAQDAYGKAASAAFQQTVQSVPDAVTISVAQSSTPNPLPSGSSTPLVVVAEDSIIGHALTYAWTSVCTLATHGAFVPDATSPATTWVAPINRTGSEQTCTITVTARDAFGLSDAESFVVRVASVPDAVSITSGPAGTPNPVESAGAVALSVTAEDSIVGHLLSYAWTATCPLGTNGTFAPSASVIAPTWIAPVNLSGTTKTCTISVTARDVFGTSATATFQQGVRSVPDQITLLMGPNGSPNPVESGGTAMLEVVATDSLGHALDYAWSSTCPVGDHGTFVPDALAPFTTWVAPTNLTGQEQTCTLRVTVTDGHGQTMVATYPLRVSSVPDIVSITAGPTGSATPVASGTAVPLSVTATDSLGHGLTYAWTSTCPLPSHGSFAPTAATALPTWVAPQNLTDAEVVCSLQVTVSDGRGNVTSASLGQRVQPVPHVLSFAAGPAGSATPVAPTALVPVSASATDSRQHALTYEWVSSCALPAHGSFSPSPSVPSPTWVAPQNMTGAARLCTLSVTVRDDRGASISASFEQTVADGLAACSYAVSPESAQLPSEGGEQTFTVTTQADCPWSAATQESWLVLTGGGNRTGSGTVTVVASAAPSGPARQGTVAIAGRTVSVAQQQTTYRYYFAEGATIGGFFSTRLALLNADAQRRAHVEIDFELKDTTTVLTHALDIGPRTRATVDVASLSAQYPSLAALASAEFSMVVRSDAPLVADRVMMWDRRGYGSHAETSIAAPSSLWYLAEGATIGDFDLYYLIQNPNDTPLDNEIEVTYLLPPPRAPVVRTYSVGARTRRNIAVNAEPGLGDVEVSAIIRTPADKPIIVERAMYLSGGGLFYRAGHESAGITSPAHEWFFAEGATGSFFDLFVLVANPNDTGARVTATFRFDDGVTCSKRVGNTSSGGELLVAARSRFNIWVDLETVPGCPRSLANTSVSTTITSDLPIIAERTMWWPGPTAASWGEAHNSPGATATGTRWGLAEGEHGGPFGAETYVLIANTSSYAGKARITLYFEDGTTASREYPLAASSRTSVAPGASEAAGGFGAVAQGRRFGAIVESLPADGQTSPPQIVVERSVYSNGPGAAFWAAGTNALGTLLQ